MRFKLSLLLSSVFLTGAGFVVADYFALFGTSEKSEVVMQEIRFRPLDSDTNSPIIGTRIRCFQKGRKKDVCFQRESGKLGVVSMKIPRRKISENSLFFEQSHHYTSSNNTQLNIMFMHLSYLNQTVRYDPEELFMKGDEIHEIMMGSRNFVSEDNE
jgi:hypothetical protein